MAYLIFAVLALYKIPVIVYNDFEKVLSDFCAVS